MMSCRRGSTIWNVLGVFVWLETSGRPRVHSLYIKLQYILCHYKQAIIGSVKPNLTTHQSFHREKIASHFKNYDLFCKAVTKINCGINSGESWCPSFSLPLSISLHPSLFHHSALQGLNWYSGGDVMKIIYIDFAEKLIAVHLHFQTVCWIIHLRPASLME